MITTYNEYLEKPKAISIEVMQDLHRQILEEVGEDWDAKELYEEDDKYFRKTIDDFACYLVFINSINAR